MTMTMTMSTTRECENVFSTFDDDDDDDDVIDNDSHESNQDYNCTHKNSAATAATTVNTSTSSTVTSVNGLYRRRSEKNLYPNVPRISNFLVDDSFHSTDALDKKKEEDDDDDDDYDDDYHEFENDCNESLPSNYDDDDSYDENRDDDNDDCGSSHSSSSISSKNNYDGLNDDNNKNNNNDNNNNNNNNKKDPISNYDNLAYYGRPRSVVPSIVSTLAVLGDSYVALILSFTLFVLSVGISLYLSTSKHSNHRTDSTIPALQYQQHQYQQQQYQQQALYKQKYPATGTASYGTSTTTTSYAVDPRLYQALGPIPAIDPPYIYKAVVVPSATEVIDIGLQNQQNQHEDLSLLSSFSATDTLETDSSETMQYNDVDVIIMSDTSKNQSFNSDNHSSDMFDELIQAYQKDGVVAVRGLISDEMLRLLDIESAILIEQQRIKNNNKMPLLQQPRTSINRDGRDDSSTITSTVDTEHAIHHRRDKRKRRGTQFFTVRHNVLFHQWQNDNTSDRKNENNDKNNNNNSDGKRRELSAFAHVALKSAVSTVAARLLFNLTSTAHKKSTNQAPISTTMRVIRDIFLAKDDDEYVCGWHVDDMGFWPATPESIGINAWIALDDMPTEHGGGFAVAVQSHIAHWIDDAHKATGSSKVSFPYTKNDENYSDNHTGSGYHNASDMFQKRTGSGTCNLHKVAPHIHQRMEETKRIYNIQRGDVIFHTRWLFHRTIPMTNTEFTNADEFDNKINNERVYRRYSIRYGPGTSIVPPGYGTEPSVLWNKENGGRSVNEVHRYDGRPWYPLAWWWQPLTSTLGTTTRKQMNEQVALYEKEIRNYPTSFANLVSEAMPIAEQLAEQRRKEMKPYLKTLAKQQHRLSTHGQYS